VAFDLLMQQESTMHQPLLETGRQSGGLRIAGRRIPLRALLLAGLGVLVAFGVVWVTTVGHGEADKMQSAPTGPCRDTESCLAIIDSFLERQPRQTYMPAGVGLMQTFGPDSFGGGDCGEKMCKLVEPCPNYDQTPHCRFDVYDNAIAAIYLTKRGKIPQARDVLGAILELLYDDVSP
jgi:hypothetical protein